MTRRIDPPQDGQAYVIRIEHATQRALKTSVRQDELDRLLRSGMSMPDVLAAKAKALGVNFELYFARENAHD